MKKTFITLITLCAVTAARAADIATTFHFNPTLSHEANPIVSVFGADARGLLLMNFLGVAIFLLVPLFLYWRLPAKTMETAPKDVFEFASLQIFARILPRWKMLSGFLLAMPSPKNWRQVGRFFGFTMSWTMIFASFLVTFSWWAIWHWEWKWVAHTRGLFAVWNYSFIEVIASLLFFAGAACFYFRMEYGGYRREVGAGVGKGAMG